MRGAERGQQTTAKLKREGSLCPLPHLTSFQTTPVQEVSDHHYCRFLALPWLHHAQVAEKVQRLPGNGRGCNSLLTARLARLNSKEPIIGLQVPDCRSDNFCKSKNGFWQRTAVFFISVAAWPSPAAHMRSVQDKPTTQPCTGFWSAQIFPDSQAAGPTQ